LLAWPLLNKPLTADRFLALLGDMKAKRMIELMKSESRVDAPTVTHLP
jgi:hypothetical protein